MRGLVVGSYLEIRIRICRKRKTHKHGSSLNEHPVFLECLLGRLIVLQDDIRESAVLLLRMSLFGEPNLHDAVDRLSDVVFCGGI